MPKEHLDSAMETAKYKNKSKKKLSKKSSRNAKTFWKIFSWMIVKVFMVTLFTSNGAIFGNTADGPRVKSRMDHYVGNCVNA